MWTGCGSSQTGSVTGGGGEQPEIEVPGIARRRSGVNSRGGKQAESRDRVQLFGGMCSLIIKRIFNL